MRKKIYRSISILTVFFFIITQFNFSPFLHAAPAVQAVSEVKAAVPFQLSLPSELGTVQSLISGTGPTLIHIQTAHGHYEAQKKIQAILHYLKENYGFKILLLEGSASQLDPERLRFFPERMDLTMHVLEDLTREGLVKGEELFLAETSEARAYGIENLSAYVANGEAFQAVASAQEKTDPFVKDMDKQIERLTSPYMNKELRAFLKRLEDFEAHRFSLENWLSYLKQEALKRLEIDLAHPAYQVDWPMLVRIFKIQELESKRDPAAFAKEQEEFLLAVRDRSLKGSVPDWYFRIQSLLTSPVSAQSSDAGEINALVENMIAALPKNFNYDAYPQVKYFIGIQLLQSELRGDLLLEEIERLNERIAAKLARNEAEKELLGLFKDKRLLSRLLALELLPEDYEEIQKGPGLHPSTFVKRFQALNVEKRVRNSSFSHLAELDALFDRALEFYRGAKARDGWMLENIEKRLEETGADKAVIVTGGFHAGPFRDYFMRIGRPYALIAPKITSPESREAYIRTVLSLGFNFLTQSTLNSPYYVSEPSSVRRSDKIVSTLEDILARAGGDGVFVTREGSILNKTAASNPRRGGFANDKRWAISRDDAGIAPSRITPRLKELQQSPHLRLSSHTSPFSLSGTATKPTISKIIPQPITPALSGIGRPENTSPTSPAERKSTDRLSAQSFSASLRPHVKKSLGSATDSIPPSSWKEGSTILLLSQQENDKKINSFAASSTNLGGPAAQFGGRSEARNISHSDAVEILDTMISDLRAIDKRKTEFPRRMHKAISQGLTEAINKIEDAKKAVAHGDISHLTGMFRGIRESLQGVDAKYKEVYGGGNLWERSGYLSPMIKDLDDISLALSDNEGNVSRKALVINNVKLRRSFRNFIKTLQQRSERIYFLTPYLTGLSTDGRPEQDLSSSGFYESLRHADAIREFSAAGHVHRVDKSYQLMMRPESDGYRIRFTFYPSSRAYTPEITMGRYVFISVFFGEKGAEVELKIEEKGVATEKTPGFHIIYEDKGKNIKFRLPGANLLRAFELQNEQVMLRVTDEFLADSNVQSALSLLSFYVPKRPFLFLSDNQTEPGPEAVKEWDRVRQVGERRPFRELLGGKSPLERVGEEGSYTKPRNILRDKEGNTVTDYGSGGNRWSDGKKNYYRDREGDIWESDIPPDPNARSEARKETLHGTERIAQNDFNAMPSALSAMPLLQRTIRSEARGTGLSWENRQALAPFFEKRKMELSRSVLGLGKGLGLYLSETQIGDKDLDELLTLLGQQKLLKRLSHLWLAGTSVTNLASLNDAENLEILDLYGTKIWDLAVLLKLANLKSLNIDGTQVSDEQVRSFLRLHPNKDNLLIFDRQGISDARTQKGMEDAKSPAPSALSRDETRDAERFDDYGYYRSEARERALLKLQQAVNESKLKLNDQNRINEAIRQVRVGELSAARVTVQNFLNDLNRLRYTDEVRQNLAVTLKQAVAELPPALSETRPVPARQIPVGRAEPLLRAPGLAVVLPEEERPSARAPRAEIILALRDFQAVAVPGNIPNPVISGVRAAGLERFPELARVLPANLRRELRQGALPTQAVFVPSPREEQRFTLTALILPGRVLVFELPENLAEFRPQILSSVFQRLGIAPSVRQERIPLVANSVRLEEPIAAGIPARVRVSLTLPSPQRGEDKGEGSVRGLLPSQFQNFGFAPENLRLLARAGITNTEQLIGAVNQGRLAFENRFAAAVPELARPIAETRVEEFLRGLLTAVPGELQPQAFAREVSPEISLPLVAELRRTSRLELLARLAEPEIGLTIPEAERILKVLETALAPFGIQLGDQIPFEISSRPVPSAPQRTPAFDFPRPNRVNPVRPVISPTSRARLPRAQEGETFFTPIEIAETQIFRVGVFPAPLLTQFPEAVLQKLRDLYPERISTFERAVPERGYLEQVLGPGVPVLTEAFFAAQLNATQDRADTGLGDGVLVFDHHAIRRFNARALVFLLQGAHRLQTSERPFIVITVPENEVDGFKQEMIRALESQGTLVGPELGDLDFFKRGILQGTLVKIKTFESLDQETRVQAEILKQHQGGVFWGSATRNDLKAEGGIPGAHFAVGDKVSREDTPLVAVAALLTKQLADQIAGLRLSEPAARLSEVRRFVQIHLSGFEQRGDTFLPYDIARLGEFLKIQDYIDSRA